jgi:hypothetical protein
MKKTLASFLVAFVFLSGGSPAAPANLDLYFSSMEKMVRQQLLTDGGRLYLFGSGNTPCFAASLANPKISAEAGKLLIHFDFSGSMAKELGGDCVGLSEDFPLTVMGVPAYENGWVYLRNIQFSGQSRTDIFNEQIRTFIDERLQRIFRHDVMGNFHLLIEENRDRTPYSIELQAMDIPRIELHQDRLSLDIDFSLTLR